MFAWIGNISNLLGYVLNFIYEIVGNYGLAIILFTLFAKIILMPLTYLQQKGSQKTTLINEEMKKIKEKYKGNDKKINEETMKLYKDKNTSPLAGCSSCLTVIVQMFLILAMFYLVSEPLTYMRKIDKDTYTKYEIRMYEEVIKEKEALKKVDKTEEVKTEKENKTEETKETEVKEKTEEEIRKELRAKAGVLRPQMEMIKRFRTEDEAFDINTEFLGLDLTDIPTNSLRTINITDPKTYGPLVNLIIPIVYMLLSVVNIVQTTKKNDKLKEEAKENDIIEVKAEKIVEGETDEKNVLPEEKKDDKLSADDIGGAMQDANKTMLYFMPVLMFTVTMSAPLSLALYWLTNTVLTFGEKVLVDKIIGLKDKDDNNMTAVAVNEKK